MDPPRQQPRLSGGGRPLAAGGGRGRRIVLFADRPIQFFEVWNSLRSQDYPFSYLEIKLGKDGTGEAQMFGAAKVRMAAGVVSIESFGATPARLLGVRVR